MTVISVIVGSTREGRFPKSPRSGFGSPEEARWRRCALLDLARLPMPFFDQPLTPATPGRPVFNNEVVQKWTAAIAQSDSFVFVNPECKRPGATPHRRQEAFSTNSAGVSYKLYSGVTKTKLSDCAIAVGPFLKDLIV